MHPSYSYLMRDQQTISRTRPDSGIFRRMEQLTVSLVQVSAFLLSIVYCSTAILMLA